MENSDTPVQHQPETPKVPEPVVTAPQSQLAGQIKSLKFLLETETAIGIVIVLVLLGGMWFLIRRFSAGALPTPSPIVIVASPNTSPVAERTISEFAKTESFKVFETKLNQFDQETRTVDLSESELSFPFLDMNVNFKL